jgi:hypothetical protein
MSARQLLLDTVRRVAAPVVRDRPRAIDRYIDYFGGHVHGPHGAMVGGGIALARDRGRLVSSAPS